MVEIIAHNDLRLCDIESCLQTILKRREARSVPTPDLDAAVAVVHEVAYRSALKLLRRWHVISASEEAYDAVQKWFQAMYESGFARYDPKRALHPLAYRILERCCIAIVKRQSKERLVLQNEEPDDGRRNWLDAMEHTQNMQALRQAIAELPEKLCVAVEQWLAHRASKSRMSFASKKQRQRFHNLMFRARRRLAVILADYFRQVGESHEFARVA